MQPVAALMPVAKTPANRPSIYQCGLDPGKYPPAEPGALMCEPLKAAWWGR